MKNLFAFLFGGLFALGLMVSGMSNPAKVLGFLDVFGDWDISLMFVMIGAIAVLFGIGWGIAGICPAPAITLIGLGYSQAWYFIAAMMFGMFIHRLWAER